MKIIELATPLSSETVRNLTAGDHVLLSGTIYTARDAAHKRLVAAIRSGQTLPVDFGNQVVYYAGPTPPPPGKFSQSFGPTTSGRMDRYAPELIEKTALRAMIGKGNRSEAVVAAMRKFDCVYFAAPGGCGALLAERIKDVTTVCYEELGAEAIYRLTIEKFPVFVAIDLHGGNMYTANGLKYTPNG